MFNYTIMKNIILSIAVFIGLINSGIAVKAQVPQYASAPWGTSSGYQMIAYHPLADSTYKGTQHLIYNSNQGYTTLPYITVPVNIVKVYLYTHEPVINTTFSGFTIKLGQTTQTHYGTMGYGSSNIPFLPTTTVFGPSTLNVNNVNALEWIPIALNTPFAYNGVDNIVVEMRYQSFTGDGVYLYKHGHTQNHIIFGNSPFTTGTKIMMHGFLVGFDIAQDWDAGLVAFYRPKDTLCTGINPVRVVVHNAGFQDLDSLRINWEANGVPQPTYYHTGTILSNDYDTITIGAYNFPANIPVTIKAWTSHPQGTSDVFNANDTFSKTYIATHDFVDNFTVNTGNDTTICEGDPITLSAGSGSNTLVTFLWDDNSTAQTRSVNTGGTYYVTVTDTSGCEKLDTIIVTAQEPQVDLGNDTTICEGDVVIFDAQNTGATYLWDDNSTNQLRYASNAQMYYVTVTDNIGCSGSDTVVLSHFPLPSGQITATLVQGLQYNFDILNPVNVTSALWNFGDGNTASGLFVTHTYNTIDTYNVSVLMYGVCNIEMSGNDEYQLIIGDTSTNSNNNIYNPQGIEIYPNPFDKGFTIKIAQDKGEIYNLKITDILGRVILENKGTIQQLNTQLSTEPTNWQNGQYILQLRNESTGEVQIKKLAAMR